MDKKEMIAQIVTRIAEKLAQSGETITADQVMEALGAVPKPRLLILTQDHGCDCHRLLESERLREKYEVCCALLQDGQADMEQIDAVILFQLTTEDMCRIASGITDTPYTKLAAQAMLLGKKLYVPREEVELCRYPSGGLGSYQCMMQAKLTRLVSWGLKICPLDQLEDCILKEAENACGNLSMPGDGCEAGNCTEEPGSGADAQDACRISGGTAAKDSPETCGGGSGLTEAAQDMDSQGGASRDCEITFSKRVITERDIIEANRNNVKVIHITERNILTALAKDAASARNIRLVRG